MTYRVYVFTGRGWRDLGLDCQSRREAIGLAKDFAQAMPHSKVRVESIQLRGSR